MGGAQSVDGALRASRAGGGAFADAMAVAVAPPMGFGPGAVPGSPVHTGTSRSPTLRALAQHLDDIERRRVEADTLRSRAVGAQAAGEGGHVVAALMYRQARALAAHNLDIMWSARVVGASAGALKQLLNAA
ncbi:hypothetical protein C0Z17_00770 [Trinickia caryophylli]|nr:hypothetical protein C0Z17_00770 [Trinickia caryophylli]